MRSKGGYKPELRGPMRLGHTAYYKAKCDHVIETQAVLKDRAV